MATYEELLSLAKEHPETADFGALRLAYTLSDSYNPYAHDTASKEINQLLSVNNLDGAIQVIGTSLDLNYVDIHLHVMAWNMYRKLNVEAKAAYHQLWYVGLAKSIFASGDGRSDKTAFIVISTSEEYAILNALGVRLVRQNLIHQAEHSFDLMQTIKPETGAETGLYFNIDLPWQWLVKRRER